MSDPSTSRWCPDDQPHEPHEWRDRTASNSWLGRSRSCPGVEDLPVVGCPDDQPHESHQWRTDIHQPLLHCMGIEEDADPHELEFIWTAGMPHPVQIICRCGDQFRVVGP